MHEQNGGERPDPWAAWTAPAEQGDETGTGRPATPRSAGQEQPEPPAPPPASVTQPLTYPTQAGFWPSGGGGYGGPPPPGYGYQHYGGFGAPPGGGYGHQGPPPGYGGPPRRRRGLATVITYIAVAALAATAGGLAVSFFDSGTSQPGASSGPSGGNGSGGGLPGNGSTDTPGNAGIDSATAHRVVSAVQPGIVIIQGTLGLSGNHDAGTGMIISKAGLVLTNNHVINQTTGLTARVVGTGAHYVAKWLGYDQGSDIAVLQLEGASGLPTVPLGDSSKVKVGDPVIGMGNANGTGSVTPVEGTITGVNQTITASDQGGGVPERLTGMLETDANIISGDSGGPLASTDGKVIGMDTAASTNSIANTQNVGFAIPINKAMTVANQIISGKTGSGVQIGSTGFVGVQVAGGNNNAQSTQTSPQGQAQQEVNKGVQTGTSLACLANGQPADVPQSIAPVSSGTLVLGVICGTPADQVHMQPGDVIIRVAGHQVSSPASLMNVLHTFHGGSRVSISWVTPSGQTVSRTLTVAAAPPQ